MDEKWIAVAAETLGAGGETLGTNRQQRCDSLVSRA